MLEEERNNYWYSNLSDAIREVDANEKNNPKTK